MREAIFRIMPRTLALALAVALVPATVSAQQDQPNPDQPDARAQQGQQTRGQCTMQTSPIEVAAGQAAADVTIQVEEQFGAITEAEPSMQSGLALASAEDIPRTDLAADEEEAEAIQMSAEGSSATLWLNTEDVEAGTYYLKLHGERGDCTAQVTVTPEQR